MRPLVVLLFVLGACDLQPPPPKRGPTGGPPAAGQPAGQPPPPPPALPTEPPAPPPVDAGAPVAPDAADVSPECIDVAAHIAAILITDAKDPAQRASLEQDRTKIVRRSAEGCTRDAWSAAAIACFKQATTTEQMQACGRNLRP